MSNNPFIEVYHKNVEEEFESGTIVAVDYTLDVIANDPDRAERRAKLFVKRQYPFARKKGVDVGAVDRVEPFTIMEKLAGPTPIATYRIEVGTSFV